MIEEVLEFIVAFFMASILIFLGVIACACTVLFILEIIDDIKDRLRKEEEE